MMVRYLGKKNDVHSVEIVDNPSRAIFSCKAPCEFIKSKQYFDGQLVKTEAVRNVEGSMIWAVMQDAENGMLTIGTKKSSTTTE